MLTLSLKWEVEIGNSPIKGESASQEYKWYNSTKSVYWNEKKKIIKIIDIKWNKNKY